MNGTDKTNTMLNCSSASVIVGSSVIDRSAGEYVAYLDVPWSNFGSFHPKVNVYRANFFRVVMEKSVATCDPSSCAYGAWSPTMQNPPSFHVTPYMGVLVLDQN